MTIANEKLARGIAKAMRQRGLSISAAEEGFLVAAFKDAARGEKRDLSEMSKDSAALQKTQRNIAMIQAQQEAARTQAIGKAVGTAIREAGRVGMAAAEAGFFDPKEPKEPPPPPNEPPPGSQAAADALQMSEINAIVDPTEAQRKRREFTNQQRARLGLMGGGI